MMIFICFLFKKYVVIYCLNLLLKHNIFELIFYPSLFLETIVLSIFLSLCIQSIMFGALGPQGGVPEGPGSTAPAGPWTRRLQGRARDPGRGARALPTGAAAPTSCSLSVHEKSPPDPYPGPGAPFPRARGPGASWGPGPGPGAGARGRGPGPGPGTGAFFNL